MEAHSTKNRAAAISTVEPATPAGKMETVKELRMLCLGVPALLSNKYFGPEDGGLFNEMLAKLEVMFGELDVYSHRGDDGIVPLQQALDLSEGLDANSLPVFVSTGFPTP